MSDGIWDGIDRTSDYRCGNQSPYDEKCRCDRPRGHSGIHSFGQIGWPDADRVVDTTYTLAEVKAMGWLPPGLAPAPGSVVLSPADVEKMREWEADADRSYNWLEGSGFDAAQGYRDGERQAYRKVLALLDGRTT